ncbi:MAG TPA: glycosyltransferase family 2 protein [Candidatus Nanoarchaeia archaeon]|nr:glycosyltransferase family 2 protein [Candidatus Nanoarchaeia archaeon]
MDLSIIIVSWNVKEKLNKCLTHLWLSQTNFVFEVFVVDNGSRDGSAAMVREEFPEVKLIANDGNLGFARAVNQAFRQSAGEFIFLLNPDNFVFPSTIDSLVNWLKINRRAALAGCRLFDKNSLDIKGQVRKFPGLFNQLAIVLKWPYLFPGILNRYLRIGFDYDRPAIVDSVRGSAMAIRRSVLESALPDERWQRGELLDERFFVWFEDVDLCRTFRAAELEVWYTPAARCYDQVGQSFSQVPRITAQKYFRASMLAYFRKWKPFWQYCVLWLAWPAGIFLTWIFTALGFEKKDNT